MARLWDKDLPIDDRIHRFTVGEDPEIDTHFLSHDCSGTAAHVRGLGWIGALTLEEVSQVLTALQALRARAEDGTIRIPPELEDGHTYLENSLTEDLGEVGEKIHFGRSRNDQVATMVRLWLRDELRTAVDLVLTMAEAFLQVADAGTGVLMPGYTHLRRAMPSSLGQWAAALAEGLLEEAQALISLDDRFDRCPLGSAAAFGVPLDLDREYVATLLGFTRVQISTMDAQNSRGRYESAFVHALASVCLVLERAICDLLLYSTEEFGFVRLPVEATTGSSIMPQKQNPDVLELARGRCREVRGLAATMDHLAGSMSTSYHRDYQLLKAPTVRATTITKELLQILAYLLPKIGWNEARMEQAISLDMFATQVAYEKTRQGRSFRSAYKETAKEVADGTLPAPKEPPPTHMGAAGDLRLWILVEETKVQREALRRKNLRAQRQQDRLWDLTTVERRP